MLRTAPLLLIAVAAPAAADERSYMLTSFDRIRVDGPFEVEVVPGPSGARAEGDLRALDRVEVRVAGNTLRVSLGLNAWGGSANQRSSTVPKITVRATGLRGATLTGSGTLRIARLAGQRVDVAVTGAGTLDVKQVDADQMTGTVVGSGALTLAGKVATARLQSNGGATIDAAALDVTDLSIATEGPGEAHVAARRTATVVATGTGSVRVDGPASCTVRGSAPVQCGRAR
jgi:hypothetical protein